MPNAVGMLYIYISLILSAILCLIGVVLSIVDVNKYNFGLYLALLSIVTFTVALACFVVKPKVCLGPFCLTKLSRRFRAIITTRDRFRSGGGGSPEDGLNGHETLQKKRSITEVLLYRKQENQNEADLPEYPLASGSIAQTPQVHVEETGKDSAENQESVEEEAPLAPKRLRFVDELDKAVKNTGRGRAWTVGCVNNLKRESAVFRKRNIPSVQHAPRLIMCQDPHLLMHTAFPLSERGPLLAAIPGIARKSYSHEEVIDLSDYYRSETARKVNPSSADENHHSGKRHMSFTTNHRQPDSKQQQSGGNASFPYMSWRRSRTIVVKYVPVRNEWLPKAGSPVQYSCELARERSQSSTCLEATSSQVSTTSAAAVTCVKFDQLKQASNSKVNFFANLLRSPGHVNRVIGSSSHTETLV